jgi:hypothetical protein
MASLTNRIKTKGNDWEKQKNKNVGVEKQIQTFEKIGV